MHHITTNYPLKYCIEKCITENISLDEIIGFRNKYKEKEKYIVTENSSIVDYIICFIYKLIYNVSTGHKQEKIKNEILINTSHVSLSYLKQVLSSPEIRGELMNFSKSAI